MRKNLTEIVFILDRSGSMSGLERDTIGGFNSMIEQQKKAEGEALISTVLYNPGRSSVGCPLHLHGRAGLRSHCQTAPLRSVLRPLLFSATQSWN